MIIFNAVKPLCQHDAIIVTFVYKLEFGLSRFVIRFCLYSLKISGLFRKNTSKSDREIITIKKVVFCRDYRLWISLARIF